MTGPGKYYSASLGDLVFFQAMPNHLASDLVAELDCPHPKSKLNVSHIGIVDTRQRGPVRIAENHSDHDRSGVRWSLVRPRHGAELRLRARKLLVISEPISGAGPAVLNEACKMVDNSKYSWRQLTLSGLAAILRQVPCASHQRPKLWQTVHLFSRRVYHEDHTGAPSWFFSGTCVAMVDEAQCRAGAPLKIIEPPCPDPTKAKHAQAFIEVVVRDLERFAWEMFMRAEHKAAREIADRLAKLPQLLSRDPEYFTDDGDDSFVAEVDRAVSFGLHAAVKLVRELRGLGMVSEQHEHRIARGLHLTFAVLDATAYALGDGLLAPEPGKDKVYPPLMSLGLILDKYAKTVSTYRAF